MPKHHERQWFALHSVDTTKRSWEVNLQQYRFIRHTSEIQGQLSKEVVPKVWRWFVVGLSRMAGNCTRHQEGSYASK